MIYLPFYVLVGRVHNDYIGVAGSLLVLYIVRTDSFSDENGVSLRLCNVQKLVLSGPCFADVDVEKEGLLSTKIWNFLSCFRAAL